MKSMIVLAPFCGESVEAYHRYNKDGKECCCFFDNNELLEGKNYDKMIIHKPFYRNDTRIVMCRPIQSLKKQFLRLGYDETDITTIDEENIETGLVDILEQVDLDRFSLLAPFSSWEFATRIQKKRVLKAMCAPGEEHGYASFDGNAKGLYKEKSFRDEQGGIHLFLKDLIMYVTDKCSLRCKYCTAGKQFVMREEARDINFLTIHDDFERIMSLIDYVEMVAIIGGEPLIRKDIDQVIDMICGSPYSAKIGMISLITNGTIMPSKKVFEAMARHRNLCVFVSNYRNLSVLLAELVDSLARYGISYRVLNSDETWLDICQFIPEKKQLDGNMLLEKRQSGCIVQCNLVCEGKFYLCDLLNTMDRLQNIPNRDHISVDIYAEDAKDQMATYLRYDTPLPVACSWCNGYSESAFNEKHIPAAEQLAEPIATKRYRTNE